MKKFRDDSMVESRKFHHKYVIMKIESGGRGKIKPKKVTSLPKLYENMSFLNEYGLKDNDRIVVYKFKRVGDYRLPFNKNQVWFKGTFGDFKKYSEGIARKQGARRMKTMFKKISENGYKKLEEISRK